jgi:hypothetical protein
MLKKTRYEVTLRRIATGEDHKRLIFAHDKETAGNRAIVKSRNALGATMAERLYEPYEVVSCEPL